MEEEWKDIGHGYAVSRLGWVRGVSGRILKPISHTHGYHVIWMSDGSFRVKRYVHRLVCAAFHGDPPSDAHQVDHINGRRDDNRARNLRWVTKAENLAHRQFQRGSTHSNAKLTEQNVRQIRSAAFAEMNNTQIAAMFGVARETIRDIRNKKEWKHVL
jgi:hypothetical protein